MEKYNNLINGKLVGPESGKYFKNINPADSMDVIGLFADSGPLDIDEAVKSAGQALGQWSDLPAPKRGDLIYKAAQLLIRDKEKLAGVITREMGKTIPESLGDIQSSIDAAQFMAGEGRRMYGQTTFSSLYRRWALTRRFPVGVCGLITAWNAPMAIITWKLFPALICGNTVVLKPSENTPLTAYLLGEILKESGFPDGVVNIIYADNSAASEALVRHTGINLVSFTGSTKIGKLIAQECGRTLKRCSLELGGKNALIVMDDADLGAAVKAAAAGAFSTAGQRCAATSRVFVHTRIYDEFIDKLIEETKKMKVGRGRDLDTKVCPIVSRRQFDSVLAYIEDAKQSGAKLLYGGRALTQGDYAKGDFIEPTIFADIDMDSKLAQEEIFGPVLAVFKSANLEEAVAGANVTNYGLTAAIFTSNVNVSLFAMDKLAAGCCYVNGPTFGSEPHMPFGGIKQSGNGSREPGTQAIDVFSDWKTIYLDYSGIVQQSQFKLR